jgi:Tol biopolymer transport system component
VVPSSGGEPERLGLDLPFAANPVWSPDGKHLLVYVPGRITLPGKRRTGGLCLSTESHLNKRASSER